jgi:hypothetical protein
VNVKEASAGQRHRGVTAIGALGGRFRIGAEGEIAKVWHDSAQQLRILQLRHPGGIGKDCPRILRASALAGRRQSDIRGALLVQHDAGAPRAWRHGNGCYKNQANRYDRVRGETDPVLGMRQHLFPSSLNLRR